MTIAPKLHRQRSGKVRYCWRLCPYCTGDTTNRIPDIEKTIHTVTSGAMSMDIRGGHDQVGFVCLDPGCSFFLGTATTEVIMENRIQNLDRSTGEYTITIESNPIPICSGTHFWEK